MALLISGVLFGMVTATANMAIGNPSPVETLFAYALSGYLAVMAKFLISFSETPDRPHL